METGDQHGDVCVLGGGVCLMKDWVHADYIAAIVSRVIVIIVLDV